MPTTPRAIRIDDELWDAALRVADERHETVSELVRRALSAYVRTASAVVCALVALVLLSGCGGSSQAASEPQARVPVTSAPVVSASVAPIADPAQWVAALRSTKARPEVPNEPTWDAEVAVVLQTTDAAKACDSTLTQTCGALAASVGPYAADLALGLGQQPAAPAPLADLVNRTLTAANAAAIAPDLTTAAALSDVLREWDVY